MSSRGIIALHAVAAIVALLTIVSVGCTAPTQPAVQSSNEVIPPRPAAREASVAWPARLLATDSNEPALFRRSGDAHGFAWLAGGVALSPRGAVRDGRVRAYVDGPVRVRGWIAVDRLEGVVLARGRVTGTPLYLVPGDRVHLRGVDGNDAHVEASALIGHPHLARSPAFRGTFPLARLGAAFEGGGAGPTPGPTVRIRRATDLRASPRGPVQWVIPALDPPLPATVLRTHGDMLGVRIGSGPYVVGFVPASALEPRGDGKQEVLNPWSPEAVRTVEPDVRDPWQSEPTTRPELALPPLLQAAVVRPIWRVRAGARVVVEGATMATFRDPGFAVELERAGESAEVLAAADSTVTVRGMVALSDLLPLEAPLRDASAPSDDDGQNGEDALTGQDGEGEPTEVNESDSLRSE